MAPHPFIGQPPAFLMADRPRPIQHEENSCIELNGYLELLWQRHPTFLWTHVPNGGWRSPRTAGILKAMGVRKGVWDYYFRNLVGGPERGHAHWIEMKHGRNDLTPEQEEWRDHLTRLGDTFHVCYSAKEALASLVREGFLPMGCYEPFGAGIRIKLRD